jgi:hypothetical protein
MMNIRKAIGNFIIRRAINKANRLHRLTKYKFLVLLVKGKPRVYSKFQLKHLIKTRYFEKGTTIQQLEKSAIYKTI